MSTTFWRLAATSQRRYKFGTRRAPRTSSGPVPDPGLLKDNVPLTWTDSQSAGYLKACFQEKSTEVAPYAHARDLVTAVDLLKAKGCTVGPMTLNLAINYLGRMRCGRLAWSTFEKHRPATFVDARVFGALLFLSAKMRNIDDIQRVLDMADRQLVDLPTEYWNSALRCATVLPDKSPVRYIVQRMKAKGVKSDTATYNIMIAASRPDRAVMLFNRLAEKAREQAAGESSGGGAAVLRPNDRTYKAVVEAHARAGNRSGVIEWIAKMKSKGYDTRLTTIADACMMLFTNTGDVDSAYALFEDLEENEVKGKYTMTAPIMARFLRLCSSSSSRQGDRGDRLVEMALQTARERGFLKQNLLLMNYLFHCKALGKEKSARDALAYMKAEGVPVSDWHRQLADECAAGGRSSGAGEEHKKGGSARETGSASHDMGSSDHAEQLVWFVENNRPSELIPWVGRMAGISAGNRGHGSPLHYFLQSTIVKACQSVLLKDLSLAKPEADATALTLVLLSAALTASWNVPWAEPLRPTHLLAPLVRSDHLESTAAHLLDIAAEADPCKRRGPSGPTQGAEHPTLSACLSAVGSRRTHFSFIRKPVPLQPFLLARALPADKHTDPE
ncbi:hypothetical protein DIPPA_03586 [Diplonema papillatum]|nr:hypothetical protein DIPPA_03586 [Diplonema papillatum]